MLITWQNTPRWLIYLIDISIAISAVILAYLLRFDFSFQDKWANTLPEVLAYMTLVRAVSFLLTRSYAGILRYTSTGDALRVFLTVLTGSIFFVLTNLFTYFLNGRVFFIPFSIIIIDFLATSFGMITFRLMVKLTYMEFQFPDRSSLKIVIYGAGEAGITAKRALDKDAGTKYKVLAFLDDDPNKIGKKLEGIDILSPGKLDDLLANRGIAQLILSVQHFDGKRKQDLVDKCLAYNTKVLTVPPVIKWINGELNFNQIKKINIEDLLERDEIKLDEQSISHELSGKVIMITGASGSIGSEIVRQVSLYSPKQLILIDQAETPLHDLELEYLASNAGTDVEFILCDICNEARMRSVFQSFPPDIIYHAAAYKHVPMMENNVSESINTNVRGTQIVADLSIESGVEKFIMISTDKAVNPTSVMGASKRLAEIYIQALNQEKKTRFITTRFGNVLGSSGSVIPLFRSQIEKGGPLTLTHPEMSRFFMTIPEACQLVLEAGAIGEGGEIFIFDMGHAVKILDLAKKMIQLSGLIPERDIQIKYIGLRPGEKLYEELLNKEENTLPTHHPLIMIAKVRTYKLEEVKQDIHELNHMVPTRTNEEVVRKMKQIIPEFISQNSVYEKLDSVNKLDN